MVVTAPTPILNSPLAATAASDRPLAASAGDFDTFLQLLTAQLRNQDPLSPLEGTEFVAQLATFSSVEQLIAVNESVDALRSATTGSAISALSQWIGQSVSVADGSFRATGEPVRFVAPDAGAGENLVAEIATADGTVLRQLAVFPAADGLATWDGTDGSGNPVAPQDLVLTLKVTDSTGTRDVPGEVLTEVVAIRGTADGVAVDLADGRAVAPEAIARVQAGPESGQD